MAAYNISHSIQVTIAGFNTGNGELDMSRLYVREAGTITTITYFAGGTQLVGMPVIYASSGSPTGMGSLLWSSSEITISANTSTQVTASLAIGSAQEIWVGFHSKVLGTHAAYARLDKDGASASVNPALWKTQAYGTPPAGPVTGATSFNRAPALEVMFAPTTDTDRTWTGASAPISTADVRLSATDELALRKITFAAAVSVNKLRLWSNAWALDTAIKPVIYADSAGVPGGRLALGPAVTALYPGANDLPFSSDVALAAGSYWYGWIPSLNQYGEVATGLTDATSWKIVAGQYTTPPNPAPASMTVGSQSLGVAISYSLSSSVTGTAATTLAAATSAATGAFPYVDQDLDFIPGTLSGLITFTRATTAWGFNASGVLSQYAVNAPVFEYRYNAASGVWLPQGLRVEDSRTNLMFPSGDVTGTGWSSANIGARTANALAAPDGTTTAALLTDNSASVAQQVDRTATIPGADTNWYTVSMFVKAGTSDLCHLRTYMLGGVTPLGTGVGINFTFSTKATTVSGTSGAGAATAADGGFSEAGNGWYRLWVRIQNNNTGNVTLYCRIYPQNTSAAATGTIYAWGAQGELGSVPSSYIPTTVASVTRSPDSPLISSVPWLNPAAGTFTAEYSLSAIGALNVLQTVFSADDATSNERYTLRSSGTATGGGLNAIVVDGGVTQASVGLSSTLSAGTNYRTSFAYALNDIAASLNNAAVVTDASATLPTVNRLTLGNRLSNGDTLTGYLRRFQSSPVRKTNTELLVLSIPTVTGGIASTLGTLTSTASGSTVTGNASGTLAALTSAASGSTVTGAAAGTLAALTSSATGARGAAGTASGTLGTLTSAATGSTVKGTAAATLGTLTSAATGARGAAGTAAATLAALTSSASGSTVTGTATATLGTLTSTATAGSGAAASGAADLSDLTGVASGIALVTGTATLALGDLTGLSSGTHIEPRIGVGATTLDALAADGLGTVTWPPARVRTVNLHAVIRGYASAS
jgi:hypothetical protein